MNFTDKERTLIIRALQCLSNYTETGEVTLCQEDVIDFVRQASNEPDRKRYIGMLRKLEPSQKEQVAMLQSLINQFLAGHSK